MSSGYPGYMLLAYGFVNSISTDGNNYNIPNLNHDGTGVWSYAATSRAGANGIIPSPAGQKSALLIAQKATTIIWVFSYIQCIV